MKKDKEFEYFKAALAWSWLVLESEQICKEFGLPLESMLVWSDEYYSMDEYQQLNTPLGCLAVSKLKEMEREEVANENYEEAGRILKEIKKRG
jgi:hypothetical protein